MKKKLISIMLVAAMAFSMAALAGCKNSDEESEEADATASEEESETAEENGHTLTVYAWDSSFNIPALEAAELDYQTNVDPDFRLNILEQADANSIETLVANVANAGASTYDQLPDILLFQDHSFEQFYTAYPDIWVSLEEADIDWSNFSQEKLSYGLIDGVHYGAPVDADTCVAAYRVDLLEEAGYTIDDLTGCSWEEFIEIGEKVYDATGKYLLCMDGAGDDLVYIMLQEEGVSQFKDGEPYITENQTLIDVVSLIVEMAQKNVLDLTEDWNDYIDNAILGDQVAGILNGNWIIPVIEQVEENEGKWEITSLPTIEGGEGYASNGGAALYITAGCDNVSLAKDFLAYTFGGGSYVDTGTSITYDDALLNGGVVTTYTPEGSSEAYSEEIAYFNDTPIYQQIATMTPRVSIVEHNAAHYDIRDFLSEAIINIINGADEMTELEQAEAQIRFKMGID